MTRISFNIEVSIFDGGDTIPTNNYIETIKKWYIEAVYDQLNFTIDHVENSVFKIEYDTETEEDDEFLQIEKEMIADPDDDGNYPIIVNNRYYLISGKVF